MSASYGAAAEVSNAGTATGGKGNAKVPWCCCGRERRYQSPMYCRSDARVLCTAGGMPGATAGGRGDTAAGERGDITFLGHYYRREAML